MNKEEMIKSIRNYLSHFNSIGKKEEKILDAIKNIDRKDFIDDTFDFDRVYVDAPLPIGLGQTISQPSTIARMIQLLNLKEGDSVLEIGTGSGWNAALISFLVGSTGRVISLEIYGELAGRARQKIIQLGIKNLEIREDDFRLIEKKFNKIIFTAGIIVNQEEVIEDFALNNLTEGGTLICPHQTGAIIIITKEDDKLNKEYTDEEYSFVPLIL
jgi:protein-L-isoaspartate(D-aspartate) O-methyltransferase